MKASNLPSDSVAIIITREQLEFMIANSRQNESYAVDQLLKWSTLPPVELEAVKDSYLKLDALKQQFRELRLTLERQLND